jgi:Flp pilus assembly protein TadG
MAPQMIHVQPKLHGLLRARRRHERRGQAMVEFGLVLPIFILLIIGLIEFALAFNANLAVNFASREAALIGAESGNDAIADCRILQTIENSIDNPAHANRINQVRIYRAGINGNELGANVYSRGGNITCTFWDGVEDQEIIVNYTLLSEGYPTSTRCNQLEGCAGQSLDTIGVSIDYTHPWVTPLAGIVTLNGSGFTFDASNAMRMEPVL